MNSPNKPTQLIMTLVILLLSAFFCTLGLTGQDLKNRTISLQDFKRAQVVFKKAEKMFVKGKLDEAEQRVTDSLGILPQHADALFLSAQILMKKNNYPKALEMMDAAKTAYPQVAEFLALSQNERLARNQDQLNFLKAQEESLIVAMTGFCVGNPGRSVLEQSLASVKCSISILKGNAQKPVLAHTEPPADYHYITGNILYKLGQPEAALVEFETATRLDPTHSRAYNNMALAQFSLNRHNEALSCLIRAELCGAAVNSDFKKALEEKVSEANLYK